jgi:hypothetical protein
MKLRVMRPGGSVGRGSITRAELEEYRLLAETHKALSTDLAARRESLAARVRAGVKVEIGPWMPQLVRFESRRFSAAAVARVLGTEVMEEIRAEIAPTVTEIFGLIPREGWHEDRDDEDQDGPESAA